MNRLLKSTAFLSLFLFVILGSAVSNGFCGSSIGDLRKAAEKGDAQAQSNLGRAYYNGEGVPKDEIEALKWYRKAAEQGDAEAQYALALAYAKGEGVPQNFAEYFKWLRKAAEQGHADAQLRVGLAHNNGSMVPKNYRGRQMVSQSSRTRA